MKKTLYAALAFGVTFVVAGCNGTTSPAPVVASSADSLATATPIKHLVVIFGENISFDHYFGTYPNATNPAGEPAFTAAAGTPTVNTLTGALLTNNGNMTNAANGTGVSNPFRLDRSQAATADQNHNYTAEQQAEDNGVADLFPKFTGVAGTGGTGAFGTTGLVMGYYDGNTVTALWNYAQHFAMNDNSYSDQYGPSTPGAINLISGQTNGFISTAHSRTSYFVADGQGGSTDTNDVDPSGDTCSSKTDVGFFTSLNVGDLLNSKSVTWGWFEGGFNLGITNTNGTTGCKRSTDGIAATTGITDYIPHHQPFQYYSTTANPTHARPSSTAAIGAQGDAANHQYDIQDFFTAVKAGNYPAVSFLKASAFQDAHAGYSDPLDEQTFVTEVVNFLEQQPDWSSTAVIVLYDDSDGWYDHVFTPVTNASFDVTDQLTGAAACGTKGTTKQANGVAATGPVNGRCGPGVRQPFLVISPWAKANFIDHTLITQASVTRFIEDNWLGGKRIGAGSFDASTGSINGMFDFTGAGNNAKLFLDNSTGAAVATPSSNLPQ